MTRPSTATTSPSTRTLACLSGVAASMWTDERTPRVRRNGRIRASGGEDVRQMARLALHDLARVPLGRAPVEHRPDVVHRQQEADACGDLVVGGVALGAADHAAPDQLVDVVDHAGQGGEIAP